jgi:hypothetical protein
MAGTNPRDNNNGGSVGISISGASQPWTGSSLSGVNAGHITIVDSSGNQITPGALSSSSIVGQYKLTGSAVQLSNQVLLNGVIFTAKSTNTGSIFLGGASVNTTTDGTGNGYILEPGASISAAVTNVNVFYAIGTVNDVLSWMGS